MGYQIDRQPLTDVALIDVRCTVNQDTGYDILILNERHWLVRSTRENEAHCYQSIVDRLGDDAVVTINSDQYAGVSLRGNDCRAILSQACSLDLDTLSAGYSTRCRFARTAAIVHVIHPANHIDVFVEASYADYLSEWLTVAIG